MLLSNAGTPAVIAYPNTRTTDAATRRKALLVLGMHRSGTSALTRVLSLLGADLPSQLLKSRSDSSRTDWASSDITGIHDRALACAGLTWDDVSPMPECWWHSDAAQVFEREILGVLQKDFSASSLFVIKDPRICRLLPLWTSLLTQFESNPAFIIGFRNPLEVLDSLKHQHGVNPARAALLWLRHVIESEVQSRGRRRSFVSYSSLLRDWRTVADRLATEFEIAWPSRSCATDLAVDNYLDLRLRHEERTDAELCARRDIVPWVQQVYTALLESERGDQSSLVRTIDAVSDQLALADLTYVPMCLELDETSRQLASHLKGREGVIAQLADEKEQAAQRAEGEVQALARELSLARDQAARSEGEIRGWQGRIEHLQETLDRMTARATDVDDERTALRQRLASQQVMQESWARELEAKSAAMDRGEARLHCLAGELAETRELAREHQSVLARLNASLAEECAKTESVAARLSRKEDEFRHQQATTVEIELAKGRVAHERDAATATVRELAAALAAGEERIGQLQTELGAVLASTCWRLTAPIRRFLSSHRWATRLVRGSRRLRAPVSSLRRSRVVRRYRDRRLIQSSRMFDRDWYLANNPDVSAVGVQPLEHYLRFGAWERRDPSPLFATAWYLEQNPDVAAAGANPLAHYLRAGAREGRDARPDHGTLPSLEQNPNPGAVAAADPVPEVLDDLPASPMPAPGALSCSVPIRRTQTRPGRTMLFAGHDASLTGAPRILLNLVRQASHLRGIECVTILDEGGPLAPAFAEVSRLYILGQNRHGRSDAQLDRHLAGVLDDAASRPPFVAVCNTVETAAYVPLLKKRGIPVVALIHELMSFYSEQESEGILGADAIVCPSEFVFQANASRLTAVAKRVRVLPQGLLNPAFGKAPPVPRSELFRPHDVSEESLIVLGCGNAHWRKGFDLFCLVAEKVVSRLPDLDVRFCWVGQYEDAFHTAGFWGPWELSRRGLEHALIRIWELPDTEPYFQAADLFVLTSRADPFPCVVHEAMAVGVPVIAFEGGGGAPEAIRDDAGVIVPYADTEAMAVAVQRLLLDPERRRIIGEVGRERVHEEYSFERYGENVLSLACESAGVARRGLGGCAPHAGRGRVVFSASDWSLSGVNTFTHELASYLLEQGYEVEIVFTQDWAMTHDRRYLPNVPFTFLECESPALHDRWKAFEAHLAAMAPCVFIPNYDFAISAVSSRLPRDVGIVGIVHSDDVDHYEHTYRLGHYWNHIVAVSEAVGDEVVRLNPAFSSKLSVIRYGIDIPEAEQIAGSRADRTPGPLRLIYAGRFVEYQKRIMDYVKLVHHLEARGLDFHLTMVGDGEYFDTVEHELSDAVRRGRVTLTGRLTQSQTRAAMKDADVLLLLSDFEGLPMALLEALHLGCVPVVNRMRSGIPEVLVDGVNGYIVEPGDWDGVARRLEGLYASPVLLNELSAQGPITVNRCGLDRATMGAKYSAVVDQALAEVREGRYRRPDALVPASMRGVTPPPQLYAPMMQGR